jgi:ABC-type bacteriocin/lantibiotic exporter with double-glycine peptidase domain
MIKKLLSLIKISNGVMILFILISIGAIIELLSFGSLIPIIYFLTNQSKNEISAVSENLLENILGSLSLEIEIEYLIIALILLIFFAKFIYIIFLTIYQTNFSINLEIKLINFFLNYYLTIKKNNNKNVNTAELIRNIQTEVQIFSKSVFRPILSLLLELLILAIAIVALLIYNLTATLILIGIFSLLSILYFILLKKKFYYWGKLRQYHVGKQLSILLEALNLRKIINLYNLKYFFLKKLNHHLNEQKKLSIKNSVFSIFPKLFLEFFLILLVSFGSILFLLQGNDLKDLFSILIVYIVISARLLPAVSRIALCFQSISTGRASVNILFEEKVKFQQLSITEDLNKISFNNSLKIENLDISVFDEKKVDEKIILENAEIEIPKGKFIGIIGKSGVGKTTLINYLSGLIKANKSKVFVDQKLQDNSDYLNLSGLGFVTQESLILDGTIKENLFFKDNPEINEKNFKKIIEITDLKEFIENSKNGLDTFINEKGSNISGGQIQKIMLARALNIDPTLLILDEATSALDIDTENKILNLLKSISKLTCIIISHRKETLAFCDLIYEIENKKIVKKK